FRGTFATKKCETTLLRSGASGICEEYIERWHQSRDSETKREVKGKMHYLITGGATFIGSHLVEVALGAIDPWFGAIISGCLCTLLCLFCIYLFLPRTHAGSLSGLDVAKLLGRDVVPLEADEAHIVL